MNLNTRDLKFLLYSAETFLGLFLLVAGSRFLSMAGEDLLSYGIAGIVLLFVGLGCVFFGCEAYLLRDDEDVWR